MKGETGTENLLSDYVASKRSDWLLLRFEFSRVNNNHSPQECFVFHVNGREITLCFPFFSKRNTTGPTFVMKKSGLSRFWLLKFLYFFSE